METNATAAAAGVPRQRLEFTYDSQSRRIRKVLKEWDAAQQTFVLKRDTRFLYDGWNVIAEFESSTGVPLALSATYAWGLDLSGTETGAGGVGGLLFVKLHATPGSPVLAPCYDGTQGDWREPRETNRRFARQGETSARRERVNGFGNILAYLDCATGQTLARYEYDPFGKLLLKEEDTRVAGRLHHQFSTKYTDEETGLSYYGYRYYAPELGRWVSRDPIGERGGALLYGFVQNNPISRWDYLGLDPPGLNWDEHDPAIQTSTTVPACHIIIFVGHNNTVPQGSIGSGHCAASHVVSCGGNAAGGNCDPATPYRPIPGAPDQHTGTETTTLIEGAHEAEAAFSASESHALTLCSNNQSDHRCCCQSVTISIQCDFGNLLTSLAFPSGICGKTKSVPCNR